MKTSLLIMLGLVAIGAILQAYTSHRHYNLRCGLEAVIILIIVVLIIRWYT